MVSDELQPPLAEPGESALVDFCLAAQRTMRETRYRHRTLEEKRAAARGLIDERRGIYEFDCVGMLGWALWGATPVAAGALYDSLGIAHSSVPGPTRVVDFLRGLPANNATMDGWHGVTLPHLTPGDVLAWPLPDDTTEKRGHCVIVAGPLTSRSDEVSLFRCIDSAARPHGPRDTRRTDPRCQPSPIDTPSGLGFGTMALATTTTGYRLRWAPDSRDIPVEFAVGRPIR